MKDFKTLLSKLNTSVRKVLVLAAAEDPHALEAVFDAYAKGLVNYLLVGNPEKITAIAKQLSHTLDTNRIIPAYTDEESAFKAVELIREGKGDFLMKGRMQTATLLSAVVNKETGIRTGKLMSHLTVLEIPHYPKLLAVSDGGMVISPDLKAKKDILRNSVEALHQLGVEQPKVAVLCAVETVNPKMPETQDAVELKNMASEFPNCIIEGPISFDLAFSKESAEIKGYHSPVTGEVDLLVVPSMATGNILCKSMIYMSGAIMAGCILGAKVPIALTSRGASEQEKLYSIALCAALATNKQ